MILIPFYYWAQRRQTQENKENERKDKPVQIRRNNHSVSFESWQSKWKNDNVSFKISYYGSHYQCH